MRPLVQAGAAVRAGRRRSGGSRPARGLRRARCLHWGARRGDDYLDPLALLRAARARCGFCRGRATADGVRRAGAPAGRCGAAARPRRACRSGSSPGWRGPSSSCTLRRSAPPSSRWVAAVCRSPCGPRSGAPGTRGRAAVHDPAHGPRVEPRRRARRAAAPARTPRSASAGRPCGEPASERPVGGQPVGDGALLRALAEYPQHPPAPVDVVDVEADQLGHPDAGGVEQLDHQPVAQHDARRRARPGRAGARSSAARPRPPAAPPAGCAASSGWPAAGPGRSPSRPARCAQAENVRSAAARRAIVAREAPRVRRTPSQLRRFARSMSATLRPPSRARWSRKPIDVAEVGAHGVRRPVALQPQVPLERVDRRAERGRQTRRAARPTSIRSLRCSTGRHRSNRRARPRRRSSRHARAGRARDVSHGGRLTWRLPDGAGPPRAMR